MLVKCERVSETQTSYIQFSSSQGILHTSKGARAHTTLLTHNSVSVVWLANGLTFVLTLKPLLHGERSVGLSSQAPTPTSCVTVAGWVGTVGKAP